MLRNRLIVRLVGLSFGVAGAVLHTVALSAQATPSVPQKPFIGFNPLRCAAIPSVVERNGRREPDTAMYVPTRDTLLRITTDSARLCEEVIRALPEDAQELLNVARVKLIVGDDSAARSARARYLAALTKQPVQVQAWANLLIIQDDTAVRPVRLQSAREAASRIDSLPFKDVWWFAIEGHAAIAQAAYEQWVDSIAIAESNRVIALWRSLDERTRASELRDVQSAYVRKADYALRLRGLATARAVIDTAVRDIPAGIDMFPIIVHRYRTVLGNQAPAIEAPFWFRRGDNRPRPAIGKITIMAYFGFGGPSQDRLNRIVNRLQQRLGAQHFEYILVTRTRGYYLDTAPAAPADEARFDSVFMLHQVDSAFVANHPKLNPMLAVIETQYHWNVEGRRINHRSKFEMDFPYSEFILVDRQGRIRYLADRFHPWMEEPLADMVERILKEDETSGTQSGPQNQVRSHALARTLTEDILSLATTCIVPVSNIGTLSIDEDRRVGLESTSAPASARSLDDSTNTILDRPPVPGKVIEEVTVPSAGVTVWWLSNGVRLVLKPTTLARDQVLVKGYSWGGSSLLPPEDRAAVQLVNSVISHSGLGRFNKMELGTFGVKNGVSMIGRLIQSDREELFGAAARRGLESLFQMFQLVFTSPRMDTAEAQMSIARGRNEFESAVRSLAHHFKDSLKVELWSHHPRSFSYSVDEIEQTTPGRAFDVLRDRFSDASGFTFVIVGSFSLDGIRPLAERYLASLPALHRKDHWKSHGIRYPSGIVRKTFKFGSVPRSHSAIVFNSPIAEGTSFDVLPLKVLAEVLKERLRVRSRQQLSGAYDFGVSASSHRYPTPRTFVQVEFDGSPERIEALSSLVIQEVERLRNNGPSEEEISLVRGEIEQEVAEAMATNEYWTEVLQTYAMSGRPFRNFTMKANPVDDLTVAIVHAYAKKYLDPKRYVQLTQVPE